MEKLTYEIQASFIPGLYYYEIYRGDKLVFISIKRYTSYNAAMKAAEKYINS